MDIVAATGSNFINRTIALSNTEASGSLTSSTARGGKRIELALTVVNSSTGCARAMEPTQLRTE